MAEEEEEEQAEVLGERATSRPRPVSNTVEASPEVQTVAAQELPFTGLDTGLIALAGAGLLGTGVVLRRRTQTDA